MLQHLIRTQKDSQPKAYHIYDTQGRKQTLELLLQGNDKETWRRSASNEIGRLTQGNTFGIQGTNTMEFITKDEIPDKAKVTYASFDCNLRSMKKETHRVQMVVGGDKLT